MDDRRWTMSIYAAALSNAPLACGSKIKYRCEQSDWGQRVTLCILGLCVTIEQRPRADTCARLDQPRLDGRGPFLVVWRLAVRRQRIGVAVDFVEQKVVWIILVAQDIVAQIARLPARSLRILQRRGYELQDVLGFDMN